MKRVIKKDGKSVSAWELGKGSTAEQDMIAAGKLVRHADGSYALFSQEAVNGRGETAQAGDFFKIDHAGFPYPNARDWFLANHRHLEGDRYEQLPRPLLAWTAEDELCPEIAFLLAERGLVLNPDEPTRYFTAPLWGTVESAARDAVLVFYSITRTPEGMIADVDFNLVAHDEFVRSYRLLADDE